MTFEFMGQDFSNFVIGYISENVDKAGQLTNIAEKTTDIRLSDTDNRFSKMLGDIEYIGEKVYAYDEFGDLYIGQVKSGRKDKNTFILTCESFLAPFLKANIILEQVNKDPATIIKNALVKFGLSEYIDNGSFEYAKEKYDDILCNAFAIDDQNMTLANYINQVGSLASLSIVFQNGKIRCIYPVYPDSSLRDIIDTDFLDVPSLSTNAEFYTAYSVDFIGSGTIPLPAKGGDDSTGRVWLQSTGAGSPVQVSNEGSANKLGELKIISNKSGERIISGRVDVRKFPVYTDDVYNFDLISLNVSGLFRVQSYTRNENTAVVKFWEVL